MGDALYLISSDIAENCGIVFVFVVMYIDLNCFASSIVSCPSYSCLFSVMSRIEGEISEGNCTGVSINHPPYLVQLYSLAGALIAAWVVIQVKLVVCLCVPPFSCW